MGEVEKTFGEVYDFVHRNNLPVCIFRLWTRASLNFGELNLYPPPLKIHAQKRQNVAHRDRRRCFFLFHVVIHNFYVFRVSGLC